MGDLEGGKESSVSHKVERKSLPIILMREIVVMKNTKRPVVVATVKVQEATMVVVGGGIRQEEEGEVVREIVEKVPQTARLVRRNRMHQNIVTKSVRTSFQ